MQSFRRAQTVFLIVLFCLPIDIVSQEQSLQGPQQPVTPPTVTSPPNPAQTASPNRAAPAASGTHAPTPIKRNADGNLILEDGTPLRLRLTRNLSSATAREGERVDFEVMDDVRLGDTVVIQQGGIAWASVTQAEHKKTMGRGGKLDVNINAVKMTNGDKANLRGVQGGKGGGHVGAMTGAMVATSIVFFPAAPLFLFMHGKDITIPQGTEVAVYVNGDTVYVAPPPPVTATAAKTVASDAELEIASVPDNADIEIDGAFSGDTPSTIHVAPGDHTITITKKGYAPWSKKVHLSTGHVTLKAELEKDAAQ